MVDYCDRSADKRAWKQLQNQRTTEYAVLEGPS